MKVTLLGTGCPQCDPDRLGPASLVQHGSRQLLIDAGSGATQRLVSAGSSGRALDAVFLTHLHSDHIVDLFQLVISSWHQGRDRPQRIYGPAGTRRFVDGLMALWRPELEQRIAHELRPSAAALEVEVTEIDEGEVLRIDDVAVRAVAVNHLPVKHAFGFAIEAGGRRAVFSGDTAPCPALAAAAHGADLLVHECFIHGIMRPEPGLRTQAGLENVARYHTASGEIGKIAAGAQIRCLLLNHFVPTRFDKDSVLAEVRRDYRGPVLIGEDLMSVDLATGVVVYAGARIGLAL
ncbi:MAG TPA: MBL fold metallo-hydrolase [Stellaceae bacterium]|nr:MBL fold metallo-hydrolase [Stellaceae bacterium]